MSVKGAFAKDGFTVIKEHTLDSGRTGVLAESDDVINHATGKKKQALYVEGSAYEMGFLVGVLATDAVEQMTGPFSDNILIDFIDRDVPQPIKEILGTILKDIVGDYSKCMAPTIPDALKEEMRGIEAGCKQANPKTPVTYDKLWTLNAGFDAACAWIYAPAEYWEDSLRDMKERDLVHAAFELERKHFSIPIMCNGFSVFGNGTTDGSHFMGRDFQFPTADVFQNVATMTIYNPDDGRLPLVSMAAPGFVGSMTALNTNAVAAGVDMAPAGNSNPKQPGLNSLLLVRHTIHNGDSAQSAADVMVAAERGVTWAYILADGKNGRSAAVEAGAVTDDLDPLSYPPGDLSDLLPTQAFLDQHAPVTAQNGLIFRWNDYAYPKAFLDYNKALFEHFDKPYNPDAWGKRGFIDKSYTDTNCPEFYFFCPQREDQADLVILTNQYTTPRMRLCQMAPWSSLVSKKYWNDVPWRYDALNDVLQNVYGTIDADVAWTAINFLSPTIGKYPDYYVYHQSPEITYTGPDGKKHKTMEVHGATSLCDLNQVSMKSLYGYFADGPVTITLPNYVA